MTVYALDRDPNSLEFEITPNPDQITIFDYIGEDLDYERMVFSTDPVEPVVTAPAVVYRDTGVPMGFRHWAHPEPIDTVEYYILRFWTWIKKGWDKLWEL